MPLKILQKNVGYVQLQNNKISSLKQSNSDKDNEIGKLKAAKDDAIDKAQTCFKQTEDLLGMIDRLKNIKNNHEINIYNLETTIVKLKRSIRVIKNENIKLENAIETTAGRYDIIHQELIDSNNYVRKVKDENIGMKSDKEGMDAIRKIVKDRQFEKIMQLSNADNVMNPLIERHSYGVEVEIKTTVADYNINIENEHKYYVTFSEFNSIVNIINNHIGNMTKLGTSLLTIDRIKGSIRVLNINIKDEYAKILKSEYEVASKTSDNTEIDHIYETIERVSTAIVSDFNNRKSTNIIEVAKIKKLFDTLSSNITTMIKAIIANDTEKCQMYTSAINMMTKINEYVTDERNNA